MQIMLLDIDIRSGVPIYRQIIEQVGRLVMTGELAEGDQLVPVRKLAKSLNVNPMTVSKAYCQLEGEGLVERRRGVGLFVARIRESRKNKARGAMLEEILRKGAAAAVRLGVSEDEAMELFSKMYGQYDSKKERRK